MKEPIKSQEISYLRSFAERYKTLSKISRKIKKININQCNGYKDKSGNWDEEAEKSDTRKEAKLLNKASEIAQAIGLKVYHQEDPRGRSLYLITEEESLKGSSANYTDGIAVY
jgi:hypothetical protein